MDWITDALLLPYKLESTDTVEILCSEDRQKRSVAERSRNVTYDVVHALTKPRKTRVQ